MANNLLNNENSIVVEGAIESIIYHNDGNGFTVFTIRPEGQLTLDNLGGGDMLTCTAFLPELREGEVIKAAGSIVQNPRYGRQLSVKQIEKTVPSSREGMEKYLGSGVIKGIGVRTAKRIVAMFGEDSFDVIEEKPEKLTAIRGISLEKALRISEAFHTQAALRNAMLFLQGYGISPVTAMKIYKKYKENTVELVKSNPFRLADDIDGIGFKTADGIAFRLGVAFDAQSRISAGVRYILWEASGNGHTFMPAQLLSAQAETLLGVDSERISSELLRMQMDRLIIREKDDVFLSTFYYAEIQVARKLTELVRSAEVQQAGASASDDSAAITAASVAGTGTSVAITEPPIINVKAAVAKIEKETGIALSDGQREAVLSSAVNGVLIITGGPGTGKTTAINTIINLLSHQGASVTLCAPTGRAAKRMAEATGMEAKTIHRLLESAFISEDSRRQTFNRHEENPLETDVLIVDEASMIDILLMQSLLKAVAPGTRLILVGDVDQLPSVGPGNVLKDIIASGCLPVSRLSEIFRQAQESAIIMNAHRINKGEYPVLNEKHKDFFFLRRNSPDDVINALLELVTVRLPRYMKLDSLQDIQVLTPMRKSSLGVAGLNTALQQKLNPPAPGKKEREFRSIVFREGDKVMQIKNNYDISWQSFDAKGNRIDEGEGVFNGDCGSVKHIDESNEIVTVLFDDNRQVDYDFSQLEELELAYAVTIHKSQGSEYRVVVIPIHSGPPMLLSRNLLYTAVTRAKELAVLVGVPETLYRMVDNNREVNRSTALARRIIKLFEGME